MLRSLSTTRKELGALRAVFLRSQAVRRGANYGVRALSNTCHLQANSSTLNKPILSKPQVLSTWGYNFARSYASLPEHIRVPLPALSPTMERGSIVSWEKKEGDKLNEGDLLCEIETDKATMGFETPEEGYLAKILVPGGSKDVPIGQLVCIIVPDAESVAAFKDFQDTGSAPAAAPAAAAPPPPAPVAAAPVAAAVAPPPPPPPAAAPAGSPAPPSGGRVYASPMAKKLAETRQMRLQGKGSGVHGSLKSGDLAAAQPKPAPAAAAAKPGAPAAFKDIPLTTMRSVIAKRLLESKQNLPHYYVTVECEVDKLLKLRANVNKKYEKEGVRVSVNDFIIKAVATACRKVPEANSAWMDTFIREYSDVDVSVAVSTDKGLITPIVFSADRKGVVEISKSVKELAGKARDNKLQPHEFQGGTISISNLGMFGVNQFCAVINPPQSCILAIGTTTKKLVADPDSLKGFREVNVLTVTLSADHRVVDGAVAAVWLKHFREFMEDPQTMIL
ncbi:dihydrolipoyllysine-residue acetyltransferase component of pyruvate dehydrogenase complex, mitochondrial isoform X1 [Drosophila sulfurigaster albostrigata]|uniref:dihydrolipoyllysine-residue acetyltransferase n=1 Tax=Drosophila albomicans TaxID=7291 RepID=A0A6P8WKZ4_DROAB|nr:dihydrolipoyllysine-residue acetyltransferase component of pyruvate dehydrogenase complex, mitochondrial isoform X1 [Drosophila albomicans]XP_060651144.1 dihydrolipoyllysine-residue acetyltransferase component of pyruvate dehydrogenase complex, mitochondrial isoform X1 [Drosophila nasuta]XP_062123581.1 dihydrolipoyllysine-residue acetyltransferase component of pyruvate dehydrogenase complex, mitochondrial isoform X1 [Drosophila sulfurigaster albostrigata]